jgi:cobalt/nickel transport system permease protein
MHIPDGFLTPQVFLTLDAIAIPAVGWAARRADRKATAGMEDTARIPLLGVMGAFVFAAQLINVPLGLGTSGHLLGGTLLAVALGPASAALVMTAVLVLQALLFQDGGVLALGANICNMAFVGVFAGYLPCWLWGRRAPAVFLGGLLSVLASGTLALLQLSLSGVAPSGRPLLVALGLFAIAGLLEGAITVATLRAIERLSPASLSGPAAPIASPQARVSIAAAAVLLATIGFAFASSAPDGLTHIATQMGLIAKPAWTHAPMSGYTLSGSNSAAGLVGLVCVFVLLSASGKRRSSRASR